MERQAGLSRRSFARILFEEGFLTEGQLIFAQQKLKQLSGLHTIGPYQVIEKLGEGGMGSVYKAFDEKLGRMVAIKVSKVNIGNDADIRDRFMKEARSLAKLNHSNIVILHDFDVTASGQPYMVMEFIEGTNLSAFLTERGGILKEREALEMVRQIGLALQHAHEKGLVHRDVKPANVMIDKNGNLKLGDFGLAKSIDTLLAQRTAAGIVMGTVDYLAPEQARGDIDLDIRVDIYGLGVTMYELTTGQKPFVGTPLEIIRKQILEPLTAPDTINSTLSGPCVAIIQKMLEKDRNNRYATPADLVTEINRVLRGTQLDDSKNDFIERVASLPADVQVKRVLSKLKELNPDIYEARAEFELDAQNTYVDKFCFRYQSIQDIWPIRAFSHLSHLSIDSCPVVDLNQVAGLPLTTLSINSTHIVDLTPLEGMPLTALSMAGTKVRSLTPLQKMKLTALNCSGTQVTDLGPLADMPLMVLEMSDTRVTDLKPIENTQLKELCLANTKITDLSPLRHLPLTVLDIRNSQVNSLNALAGLSLEVLLCSGLIISDLSPLLHMPLKALDISNTCANDLTALKTLPLERLDISYRSEYASVLRAIPSLVAVNGEPATGCK